MRAAVAAAVVVAALGLAGCAAPPPATPAVTGLVVAIDYAGDVATVSVSGAAEASGRHFGPWRLSSSSLTSGGTVGFIFDESDGGSAMICAQSRDGNGNSIDMTCDLFPVRAGEVMTGTLTLNDGSNFGHGGR